MNSPQTKELADNSALIDWSSPEVGIIKSTNENYINNPFDQMELEAANMCPFDLISPLAKGPLCENKLSSEFTIIQNSFSLTTIDCIADNLKLNYEEQVTDDIVRDHSKNDDAIISNNREIVDQSIENHVTIVENKLIENQESKIEDILKLDHNMADVEQISLCTEEEKKQIREETRQRIEMLIEKAKNEYKAKYSQEPLLSTTFKSLESSFNEIENVFNKGFIRDTFNSNSNSLNNNSSSKIYDNTININNNSLSNVESIFPYDELNSMDLDSLKPEWVVDSFMDYDSSTDVQTKSKSMSMVGSANNSQVNITPEIVNCAESVESKLIGCQTVVLMKSMQNNRTLNKGPFLANVPLQYMVHNHQDIESKEISLAPEKSPREQIRPVATSTPTIDISTISETSSNDSSIKLKHLSRRSIPNSNSNTPLNITKCITRSSSNGQIVLANIDINTSKSENKITKMQKPMVLKANKTISALPVLKRLTSFKEKENIKP